MSPEQVRGEKLDVRTDIFSFGVVLYEMLTGQQPFRGQRAATISAILTQEPPTLTSSRADVSEELQRIVAKALRKDREERYQTIKDMLLDVKSLNGQLEAERLSAKIKRHKKALALTLLALVMGAAGVVYVSRLMNQRRGPKPHPRRNARSRA